MQDQAQQIPEEFSLSELQAHLTEAEIKALKVGDEPLLQDAEPEPEPEPATADVTPTSTTPQVQAQQTPAIPEVPDTTEAEAQIARVGDEIEALLEQYDNAEITREQFQKKQAELIKAQAAAQSQIASAEQIATSAAEQRKAAWFASLEAFKVQNEAQAALLWSNQHLSGWDAALRAVTANQAYSNMPFERQIGLAYDLYAAEVKAMTGAALPSLGGATPPQGQAEAQQPGRRTDPRPDPVQTLAGLNGASEALVTDGSFAAIDRMMDVDPIKAERMLQALPPDKYEAYMEGR